MAHTFKALTLRSAIAPCLILFLLVFSACDWEWPMRDKNYRIKKRFVYVIEDTLGMTPHKKPELPRDTSYLEFVFRNYELADIREMDSTIQVRLEYASKDNLLGIDFYDGLRHAYLTCDLALKVCNAQYYLKKVDSCYSLLILDAARPQHIQKVMWDSINLKPENKDSYLAHPEATSLHNYGCAVDASIIDTRTGKALDMGTDFDYFSRLSRPDAEKEFLKSGMLTDESHYNRKVLRWAMKQAGLNAIASEWWHFSLCTRAEAAKKYRLIK